MSLACRQSERQRMSQADHTGYEVLLKNRRVSGLMRDQWAHSGRFFSTASGASMSSIDGSVNTPKLAINLLSINVSRTKSIQERIERAITGPVVEQSINRSPIAILRRNIPPWRTGPQDPKNGIENGSWTTRRPAGLSGSRKKVFDTFPLIVGNLVTWHRFLLVPFVSTDSVFDRSNFSNTSFQTGPGSVDAIQSSNGCRDFNDCVNHRSNRSGPSARYELCSD